MYFVQLRIAPKTPKPRFKPSLIKLIMVNLNSTM